MGRALVIAFGMLAGWSCTAPQAPPWFLPHHSQASTKPKASKPLASAEEGDACPTPETEVTADQCEDLPEGYGLSAAHPVEWGLYAAGGNGRIVPYFDRLLCPDGTPAFGKRTETRDALNRSSPPMSEIRRRQGDPSREDMIDRWEIDCGGEIISLYSNINRCGSHCVPRPFRLITASGYEAWRRAAELQKQGDLEEAIRMGELARASDPGSIMVQRGHISSLFQAKRFSDALQAIEEASIHLPENNDLHGYRLSALAALQRWEDVDRAADAFLERIEGTEDRNLGFALCLKSRTAREFGRTEEVATFRDQACAAGSERCCEEAQASNTP